MIIPVGNHKYMSHFDFKARFNAALPPALPELDIHSDEFVVFDYVTLSPLDKEDSYFLMEQGLPRNASPFLCFAAYTPKEIEQRLDAFDLPQSCFPIGYNGSGDIIGIDTETREIVYFNHDANNTRVFINSNLALFAESLCIFQEHLQNGTIHSCLSAIEAIDANAAKIGSMWHLEVEAEIASG